MGDITLVTRRNEVALTRPQYVLELRPRAMINTGGGGGGGGSVDWVDVQNKPDDFPPKAHQHEIDDVTGLQGALDGTQPNLGFTPEDAAQKGQANGYAPLDNNGFVPGNYLPPFVDDIIGVHTFAGLPAIGTGEIIYIVYGDPDPAKNNKIYHWFTDHYEPLVASVSSVGDVVGLQAALDGKQAVLDFTPEDAAQKGAAGGYAGLDGAGKVPAAQLPSFVDDVVEAANFAALPGTGEAGKIYVTLDTNKTWRWSGSAYVEISASPGSTDSVTEGSVNLYFTAARVRATDLTGYAAAGSRVALAVGDSFLGAFGKIGKWLADLAAIAFSGSASDLTAGTLPAARFDDTAHGSRAGGALHPSATTSVAGFMSAADKTKLDGLVANPTESLIIAASDETTALTAGTTKVTFRMPYAFTVTSVRASLTTAQTSGSIFTVDINEAGASILSTKLTIDNTEKTSTTAATAAVISDTSLVDDAEITIDIDQIGDGTAKGLKVVLIGYRT